jgi:hypothetical protein
VSKCHIELLHFAHLALFVRTPAWSPTQRAMSEIHEFDRAYRSLKRFNIHPILQRFMRKHFPATLIADAAGEHVQYLSTVAQ